MLSIEVAKLGNIVRKQIRSVTHLNAVYAVLAAV